jgi:hypothetical protein
MFLSLITSIFTMPLRSLHQSNQSALALLKCNPKRFEK